MISNELLEMKEQLAVLTRKLEKEKILNEKNLRQAMKEKASFVQRSELILGIVSVVMIPYWIWVVPDLLNISMGLCLFVSAMMLACFADALYINTYFNKRLFADNSLLEAKKQTLRLKKHYAWWLKWMGIPFTIIFMTWMAHDVCRAYDGIVLKQILLSMGIGLVIGLIVGIWQNYRVQQAANDILKQIEEVEG